MVIRLRVVVGLGEVALIVEVATDFLDDAAGDGWSGCSKTVAVESVLTGQKHDWSANNAGILVLELEVLFPSEIEGASISLGKDVSEVAGLLEVGVWVARLLWVNALWVPSLSCSLAVVRQVGVSVNAKCVEAGLPDVVQFSNNLNTFLVI